MQENNTVDVILRPKRQITLPASICQQLGIEIGDRLEVVIDGNNLIAKPKKVIALEALHEIREAFKRSGITEESLQETSRQIREKISGERNVSKE
jgi:AbrB family looped-hinge helix DNA binding protein